MYAVLRRIYYILNYVAYYGSYKFAIFYIPALGSILREKVEERNINVEIGGKPIVGKLTRSLPDIMYANLNREAVFLDGGMLNIPIITKDNIVMLPIYTLQSVDINEPNIDITNINYKNKEYPLFNTTQTQGDIQISYLELMTMPVARFHYIWLKYINTMMNNEYYEPKIGQLYRPPFGSLYLFNFSPDLKFPLNIYEFVKIMPTSDISVRALNGAINDADLMEITVLYRYETIRRHIIFEKELQEIISYDRALEEIETKEKSLSRYEDERAIQRIKTEIQKLKSQTEKQSKISIIDARKRFYNVVAVKEDFIKHLLEGNKNYEQVNVNDQATKDMESNNIESKKENVTTSTKPPNTESFESKKIEPPPNETPKNQEIVDSDANPVAAQIAKCKAIRNQIIKTGKGTLPCYCVGLVPEIEKEVKPVKTEKKGGKKGGKKKK